MTSVKLKLKQFEPDPEIPKLSHSKVLYMSFCEFAQLCKQFFRSQLEKNHVTQVLYMSFYKFLLAVESDDLSQADKSIIRVSYFPKAFFE